MRILVIPEDFRNDQYILKPIFERMLSSLGWSNCKVRVCQAHLLGGIDEALKPERLEEIVNRYVGMMDIFVLCVDRDGQTGRRQRLDNIETNFNPACRFLAENAWEELETWLLAGLDLPKEWRWADVRTEIHVKEQYFEPLAAQRGLSDAPGGDRKALAEQASRNINAIRQKCPDDFGALAHRLESITV